MTEKQHDALELAEQLDAVPETGADPDLIEQSAAELRRLHTENQQLRAELEAVGAGGVGSLMQHRQPLTDEQITQLADAHMEAFAQFVGAGEVWFEGEKEFARAIERAHGIGGEA